MEGGNRGNAVAENFRRSVPKSGREEQAKAAVSDALFGSTSSIFLLAKNGIL